MTVDRDPKSKLDRLAEALIEETLAMSDDEILEDANGSAEEIENALLGEISSAIASHRRQQLIAAKAAVSAHRSAPKIKLRPTGDLRTAINNAIANSANDDGSLTLAAREGRDVPDADLEGLAEDLSELGIDVDEEKGPDAS